MAYLDTRKPLSLALGLLAEAPRSYVSFSVESSHGQVVIGVISSGLGADSVATVMDGGRRVVVGHDAWVSWVDLVSVVVLTSQRLGGVFFDFVPLENDQETVVVHELGALRIDANGGVKWSLDTDVIENSIIDGKGGLILKELDGRELVVSLATGSVAR